MALSYNLDFAILYACVLALFSYLAFWFVPLATRLTYATVKELLHREPRRRKELWFDGHHSQ